MRGGLSIALRPRSHQRTLAAGTNESDDFTDQRVIGEFARQDFDSVDELAFGEEQTAIGAPEPMHVGSRRATPAQTDDIEPDQRPGLTERKAERNDVVARRRHSGHHHALADAYELVDGDMAAEEGVIANSDVATEDHVIGERN